MKIENRRLRAVDRQLFFPVSRFYRGGDSAIFNEPRPPDFSTLFPFGTFTLLHLDRDNICLLIIPYLRGPSNGHREPRSVFQWSLRIPGILSADYKLHQSSLRNCPNREGRTCNLINTSLRPAPRYLAEITRDRALVIPGTFVSDSAGETRSPRDDSRDEAGD